MDSKIKVRVRVDTTWVLDLALDHILTRAETLPLVSPLLATTSPSRGIPVALVMCATAGHKKLKVNIVCLYMNLHLFKNHNLMLLYEDKTSSQFKSSDINVLKEFQFPSLSRRRTKFKTHLKSIFQLISCLKKNHFYFVLKYKTLVISILVV